MEDKELRELLTKDNSVPIRRSGEWESLLEKLQRTRFQIKFPVLTTICLCLVVGLSIQFQLSSKNEVGTNAELAEYLLEDTLFPEVEEQLYAWVD
jgi:hypothetical protein